MLATQSATMMPLAHVYVWLQSAAQSETIVTRIATPSSIVRITDAALKYDPALGVFVVVVPRGALQHDSEQVTLATPPFD